MKIIEKHLEEISKAGYGDNFDKMGKLFSIVGIESDGTRAGTKFKREFIQEETFRGKTKKKTYLPEYPFNERVALDKMKELGLIKD